MQRGACERARDIPAASKIIQVDVSNLDLHSSLGYLFNKVLKFRLYICMSTEGPRAIESERKVHECTLMMPTSRNFDETAELIWT